MLYIERDASGKLRTISVHPIDGGEAMAEDSPEIRAFLASPSEPDPQFSTSDAEFVRVLEDLIDALISKNILRHTDLPVAAQRKINARKGMRNRLQGALRLFNDDDPLI